MCIRDSLYVAWVRVVLHQQVDLSLCIVEEVDGRRRQASLNSLSDVCVDVYLISARLGHVIDIDQLRQLLPVRRVGRLPVLLTFLPEYRVFLAEFVTQKCLYRNTHTHIYMLVFRIVKPNCFE